MRLRKTYIVEDTVIADTGMQIFNLKATDPIRAIILGFYGKRHDHKDTNNIGLLRDIDNIEIVDGSDVLFSCSGEQAGAVQLYGSGRQPMLVMTANSISSNRAQLKLNFGRDDSDNEYSLDLTKFKNPQLKIKYSFTEGTTGNWADGTQRLTVALLIAEGAPAPRGFFMTKSIYTWAKATSGDETIDMPRDYPYRFIMLHAKDAQTPIYAEFSHVKLRCDHDKFIAIDETTEDLFWENIGRYGMLTQQVECIGDGSDTDIKAWYPFAYNQGASVESWNFGDLAMVKRPYSGYITVHKLTCPDSSGGSLTATALDSSQRAIVTGRGFELFDTEVVPFGNLRDVEEFFNPMVWKSVELILTQAQTDALASAIVLQQLRHY